MPLYEIDNLIHDYNGRPVLDIQHWQIAAHSVTGVVGPNGSGKSTLLTLLAFVGAPSQGEIRFNGSAAEPFSDAVRGRVTLMPQETFLLKRSVYANVVYGLKMAGARGDLRGRVHDAMAMVGLDGATFGRRPWYALSGGEARRVALAARLVLEPQVLLMDEPTVSVDVASAQMIKEAALHARRQWGTTLIISSHDDEWLADISDEMLYLFRGRILGNGPQSLIFGPWQERPDDLVARRLAGEQYFLAPRPPGELDGAVAAIAAEELVLCKDAVSVAGGRHGLEGLLLHLNYEQTSQRTGIAVQVGRSVFKAYLDRADSFSGTLVPGQKVRLAYEPRKVQWY
jgi:tungstate transport system ATP-binding protein